MIPRSADLFDLGGHALQALIGELARYGVYVDAGLELRRGAGLLSHYCLEDRQIYLSMPDVEKPRGKFELLLLRSMISFDSSEELMRLLALLVPWLIAHETGHHLRHKYGRYGSNMWEEEQIANQLAIAFIQCQLKLAQKRELLGLIAKATASLSRVLEAESDSAFISPQRDPIRYIYTHMRWFYSDLTAQETQTIARFVQAHLIKPT